MDYNSIPFRNNVIDRLQKKEEKLVGKGYKAVDEGREKKADRLLGRAANIQDRRIRKAEKSTGLEYEPRVRKRDTRM
jgi:hypothetical protein